MKLPSFLRAAVLVAACAAAGCTSLNAKDQSQQQPMHRGPTTGAGFSGSLGSGTGSGAGPGSAAAAGSVGMGTPLTDGPGSMTGGGMSGATGSMPGPGRADAAKMCQVQRNISGAKSPEERQALMDQYMPGMSPQMREQHLQMMQEMCNERPEPGAHDNQ